MKTLFCLTAISIAALSHAAIAFSSPHPSHSHGEQTELSSIPISPGAARTTVTYGPFHLKPNEMYPHTPKAGSEKPCTDCFLTMMQTTLEDTQGNRLDMNSGVWLHHLAQYNVNQTDFVCPDLGGHFFYGSGSERPVWRTNANGRWGYYVKPGDQWVTAVELVNETPMALDVQVSVTYEWVRASSKEGMKYKDAEQIWVNIGPPCGDLELAAEPGQTVFLSDVWVSTVEGPILEARGHMHGGGRTVALYVNGLEVCESQLLYGERAGKMRLTGATACHDAGRIEKGDKLQIVAVLDEEKHASMRHAAKKNHIMGIMSMFVGVEQ